MIHTSKSILIVGLLGLVVKAGNINKGSSEVRKFPKNFKFGAATAAFQIEGAWNETGKGWSIWDSMVHRNPRVFKEQRKGEIACDSYHKYKEDVQDLKKLGLDVYRFSISWPRIMPKGLPDEINDAGVDYYHNLINELLANDIEPMITIFHWDMPEHLQNMGGFLYDGFPEIFGQYANFLFKTYGHKVTWWSTFNEPLSILTGYGGVEKAPMLNLHGTGDYKAGHNLLKAHATAYHIYKEYYAYQGGKISLNVNSNNCQPKTNSQEDKEAAERCWAFGYDYFIHPIFSKTGDYPEIMKTQVAKLSKEQGVPNRLPSFTKEEIEYIRGTYDYLAINAYTTSLVSNGRVSSSSPSPYEDVEAILGHDTKWPTSASDFLFVVPKGIRNVARWVKKNYPDVPMFFTEFGFSDHGTLEDDGRINYLNLYFEELKKAILDDGCNIIGAVVWTLMDNFEWFVGYTERFGLIHVDFDHVDRTRTWKKSAHWYKSYVQENKS